MPSADVLSYRIAVARGDRPADLVLRNLLLVNVLSGEIYPAEIAIAGDTIVGVTRPGAGESYEGIETLDMEGRYVAPGLIDAHVHIESSLCTPPEFARAVLPRGVTTAITDPHEIANVLGMDGIHFMLERGAISSINMYANASSCVPATTMETSGAQLEADVLAELLGHPRVPGLAEMMNYPGVINGDPAVLAKLAAFHDTPLDGHAPSVTGKALNAYIAAGIGSDHECTTPEEALEKLRLGLMIFIREGTTTRNLLPLMPIITPENHARLCLCTDDRDAGSLLDEGSIDFMVRTVIAHGIDPMIALRMATLNTANTFHLWDRGAIAPGRKADLIAFRALQDMRPDLVFLNGVLAARDGRMVLPREPMPPRPVRPSMNVGAKALDFSIPAGAGRIHVIGAVRDQVVTEHTLEAARLADGQAISDPSHDLLKILVIERHHASGSIGRGFISGFGLQRGALAGTVAHDHHNLVVIGVDDASMHTAAQAVIALGGGLAAAEGEQVLATLALPIAGLMSEAPIGEVRHDYDALLAAARGLGSTLPDPFMTMSFMGLEVIPDLKLTDLGLVDVTQFALIDLFEGEGK